MMISNSQGTISLKPGYCLLLATMLTMLTMASAAVSGTEAKKTGNIEACQFVVGAAISRDTPCACGADETLATRGGDIPTNLASKGYCDPRDFCFQLDSPEICYQMPCDDVSGDWLYLGEEKEWTNNWIVLATFTVRQVNCHIEMTITSTLLPEILPAENSSWFGSLVWREIWSISVFASAEDRANYENQTIVALHERPPMFLVQDFGNSAPHKQCNYFGSLAPNTDSGPQMLSRTNNATMHTIGAIVDYGSDDCPSGYPRAWSNTNNTTGATKDHTSTTEIVDSQSPVSSTNSLSEAASFNHVVLGAWLVLPGIFG